MKAKLKRAFLALLVGFLTICMAAKDELANAFVRVERVHVEVPAKKKSLREIIETVPASYGISPIVAAAIVERESNGKGDAIRFEPGQMARAARITKNPEQQRMYASSHGLFQVMGWHAPRFDLSWKDLYDQETNAEVAMAILKDCMDRARGKSKAQKLHSALACYNGSTTYADAVMARLGQLLIEEKL